jgi:hypothetical protein
MPATYDSIASTTLGSDTATVTFSSISSSYTDLVLVVDTQITNNDYTLSMRFNGDSSTLYSYTTLDGIGTVPESSRRSGMSIGVLQRIVSNSSRIVGIVSIMNYSNTTTNKTYIARGNQAGRWLSGNVGLYRSTSAISSITISEAGDGGSGAFSGTLKAGSTFSLYGIRAA